MRRTSPSRRSRGPSARRFTVIPPPRWCAITASFAEALKDVNPLICYAVKANDALAIIKTLAREGSGADVVSGGEVKRALAAGIAPEKMVFSGVGKTREEMAFALGENIFQFNVESEAELRALSQEAASLKKTAGIALRVNPDVVSDTHAKISTGHKESKFGVPIAEAPALYALAQRRCRASRCRAFPCISARS